MNTPLTFTERGAHFRISDNEYRYLDDMAKEDFEKPLDDLPIGKATTLLRAIPLAGAFDAVVIDAETQRTIASTDMDGKEAIISIFAKGMDPHLEHAVRDIGRVTVAVVKSAEIDKPDADPVFKLEILSRAHVWSKKVVELHRDSLYENGAVNPIIPESLLTEMPERAEVTLATQGLYLSPSSSIVTQTEILHVQ